MIAKLARGLLVPFSRFANSDTSEFDINDAPSGFSDLTIQLPEDLAIAIKWAAARKGISEDEYIIQSLADHNGIETKNKKPT